MTKAEWNITYTYYSSRTLLHLYIIPSLIDILDFTRLMWSFQFNDSSISTPRNFVTCTLNICVFFILIIISDLAKK